MIKELFIKVLMMVLLISWIIPLYIAYYLLTDSLILDRINNKFEFEFMKFYVQLFIPVVMGKIYIKNWRKD